MADSILTWSNDLARLRIAPALLYVLTSFVDTIRARDFAICQATLREPHRLPKVLSRFHCSWIAYLVMFAQRLLHPRICASCRLRADIIAKQICRTRKVNLQQITRFLSKSPQFVEGDGSETGNVTATLKATTPVRDSEQAALLARRRFGDVLPPGQLNDAEYKIYERLYGTPMQYEAQSEILQDVVEEAEDAQIGTGVLKETEDGQLEEVAFDADENERAAEEGAVAQDMSEQDQVVLEDEGRLKETRAFRDFKATPRDDTEADRNNDPESEYEADEDDPRARTHPLTQMCRFGTDPSTLPMPQETLTQPIEDLLSNISNTHLTSTAERVLGGLGLPYSTSTPNFAKTLQQRPIQLDASQAKMSEIEADVFLATLYPGIYAPVMSVLVETRKRLGSEWATGLVKKAERGELRILDAGGGGAGVMAVRELLRAEWERMHEDYPVAGPSTALAEADGKLGGMAASAPLGNATVLTGSDMLRSRASKLLENTTFIPRLPDYVHAENAKKEGKFDIVLAPHTLWGLREDWARKEHVENFWSLTKQRGGVLLILEKGIARGFEVVAAARQLLLDNHLTTRTSDLDNPAAAERKSDPGMIIAPCTNHSPCPMYRPEGMLKGRRDVCHFFTRYVRPPFLQSILGAKDKNFEDVSISYLSVMRGQSSHDDLNAIDKLEGENATLRAFEGYGNIHPDDLSSRERQTLPLTLPRAIWPPLKRQGHVILDLCTPSGTLERWTVPKSFGRQAFRDARKSGWGDLWALGAKTRVLRIVRGAKKRKDDGVEKHVDMDVKLVQKKAGANRDKFAKSLKAQKRRRKKAERAM